MGIRARQPCVAQLLPPHEMPAYPGRESSFTEISGCERLHDRNAIRIVGLESPTIEI